MKATTLGHLSAATIAGRDSTESLFRGALVLVDLSFSVPHFSSVVFQSRLTFIQLGCFLTVVAFISFSAVRLVGCKREGFRIRTSSRILHGMENFRDYPNCLLLLLLLLLLLVPKQYEEVREGLSVSEGGSQR